MQRTSKECVSLLAGPSWEGLWFLHLRSEKGNLELNDTFANRIAGVEIKNKADPILYQNSIHHRQTGCAYIHEKVCPVHSSMGRSYSVNLCTTVKYLCAQMGVLASSNLDH